MSGAELRIATFAAVSTLPLLYVPIFTASLAASTWVRISLRIHPIPKPAYALALLSSEENLIVKERETVFRLDGVNIPVGNLFINTQR
ncbi:hypothetical protein [Edwardsiella hoshinae]|uniref:hypothetical protein n=1 Tax=Edwardsiella hoshinae TaxID=93378 RepID=UPI0012DF84EE|nr:hypothetical protein [Edwardsiella hoshinae]